MAGAAFETRAAAINKLQPQLTVELSLYDAAFSTRRGPILPGWGCPCIVDPDMRSHGWDGYPILGDEPMQLGETRVVGYVFLSGTEAASALSRNPKFFLWESGLVGEARILNLASSNRSILPEQPTPDS
jgi:hypothetical protein